MIITILTFKNRPLLPNQQQQGARENGPVSDTEHPHPFTFEMRHRSCGSRTVKQTLKQKNQISAISSLWHKFFFFKKEICSNCWTPTFDLWTKGQISIVVNCVDEPYILYISRLALHSGPFCSHLPVSPKLIITISSMSFSLLCVLSSPSHTCFLLSCHSHTFPRRMMT